VSFIFCQKGDNINEIIKRDKLYYKKFTVDLVDGMVYKLLEGKQITLGQMRKGEKFGEWKDWYENGQLMTKENYKNGLLNGESKYWDEGGNLKYIKKFRNGVLNGKQSSWYSKESKICEATYLNGKKEGDYVCFYSNGQKKIEGALKNGLYHGVWETWFFDGKKCGYGEFENGNGDFTDANHDGSEVTLHSFSDGILQSEKCIKRCSDKKYDRYNTDDLLLEIQFPLKVKPKFLLLNF